MTSAIIEVQNSVITSDTSVEYVTSGIINTIHQTSDDTTFIATPVQEYILVEQDNSSLVLAGGIGPIGPAGIPEDDIMYSKRVDFISDSILYRGEAAVGSAENLAVWRIRKIVISEDGDVTETWAAGTAAFDKVWADRVSLTYI